MPVIPKGIAPFTIKAPLTTGDKGEPTASVLQDAKRVFDFIEDERHLMALDLYQSVKKRIDSWDKAHKKKTGILPHHNNSSSRQSSNANTTTNSNSKPTKKPLQFLNRGAAKKVEVVTSPEDVEYSDAKAFLQTRHPQIIKLENRCRIFKRALQNLNVASDWTLASSLFGVKTYYRREEDGSLSVKLEGDVKDVPLFEQVCVLKEIDLHYKWAPFCSSSMTIADLDKLDTVGWFVVGLPNFGLSRDGVFRAIGCDSIMEDNSIILAGQGVRDLPPGAEAPRDTYLCEDPVLEKLDIPPIPTRRGGGRMTIRTFEAVIHVTSPTSARTRLVANVDPNMTFLPQPLLEFVMKNLAGVLLAKLQSAAKKIPRNPLTNAHARRMRDEEDFYRHWLMKKFKAVADMNGWEMPGVTAFELSDDQLRKDHQSAEKRSQKDEHRRAVSFQETVDDSADGSATEGKIELRHAASMPEISESLEPETETDNVSELSSRSYRTLPSLGIGQMLKGREERKRQKKEELVAQERLKAAERLRPKDLSPDKMKRLEELRSLKAARTVSEFAQAPEQDPRVESEPPQRSRALPTLTPLRHADSAPMTHVTTASTHRPRRHRSVSEKVTDRLYRLGPGTRLAILFLLTILLFILLHPKLLLSLVAPRVIASWSNPATMMTSIGRGTAVILYTFTCTAAHFLLCDIALVYAFDSLELGSKAGRQMRKFYSIQVRLGVALFSLGIAWTAIGKALVQVWLRYMSWSLVQGLNLIGHQWAQFQGMLRPLIPSFVANAWSAIDVMGGAAWASISSVVVLVGKILNLVINSNVVTQKLAGITASAFSVFPYVWNATRSFSLESVAIVTGEIETTPWYEESFVLAKSIFSYTAVFLVTALILFNLSAKQAASKSIRKVLVEGDDLSTHASDLDSATNASSNPFKADLTDIPEHPSSIIPMPEPQKEVRSENGLRRRKI